MKASRDEIAPVMEKALREVDDRDASYGLHWMEEEFPSLIQNVFRKGNGIRNLFDSGKRYSPKMKEHLLDNIAYSAMVYRRLELDEEEVIPG